MVEAAYPAWYETWWVTCRLGEKFFLPLENLTYSINIYKIYIYLCCIVNIIRISLATNKYVIGAIQTIE